MYNFLENKLIAYVCIAHVYFEQLFSHNQLINIQSKCAQQYVVLLTVNETEALAC